MDALDESHVNGVLFYARLRRLLGSLLLILLHKKASPTQDPSGVSFVLGGVLEASEKILVF